MKFAENAFRSDLVLFNHFKNFVLSNPVINSLMYIPIHCAIIAQVYKDIRKSHDLMPKTMTKLYIALIQVLIRRHMIEIGKWDEHSRVPSKLEDLPEEIAADLKRICELAYNGLLKDFYSTQLEFTEKEVGNNFHPLGLLNETKEMYVCKGACTSYSFHHLSLQEFLAACHVSYHPHLIDEIMFHIIRNNTIKLKHLTTFVLFLAGLIGCDKLRLNCDWHSHVSQFKLNCLYESQNPSNIHAYLKASSSVFLDNPLAMYMFGYVLIHAPVQWDLTFSASFDMLLSSLSDNAHSDGKILGSIRKLDLYHYMKENSVTTSRLDDFPKSLLKFVTGIEVGITESSIPVLIKDISNLHDLQSLYLDFPKSSCPSDYLLFQSLQNISNWKNFCLHFYHITQHGMQKLNKVIASSKTLEHISIAYFESVKHTVCFSILD